MSDIGQQGPEPAASPLRRSTAGAWWRARGAMAKVVIAASLALGGGLGTVAIAHAASASPSASPAPSATTSPGATTHNCPNM